MNDKLLEKCLPKGKQIPYKPDDDEDEIYGDMGEFKMILFMEGARAGIKRAIPIVREDERQMVIAQLEDYLHPLSPNKKSGLLCIYDYEVQALKGEGLNSIISSVKEKVYEI